MRHLSITLFAVSLCSIGAAPTFAQLSGMKNADLFATITATLRSQLSAVLQQKAVQYQEGLRKLPVEQLAVLFVSSDPCRFSSYVNCDGLASDDAKAFAQAEWYRRQAVLE